MILTDTVGQATAAHGNSRTSFGIPLTAAVAQNSTYAGLESDLNADSSNGVLGSKATILDGTAGSLTSVSMAWRTRTTAEQTRHGGGLISDVVDLTGIALHGSGLHDGSHQSDIFVLEMSYSPTELQSIWGLTEAQAAAQGRLYLGYLDLGPDGVPGTVDDRWENAVFGNFGGVPNFVGDHPYSSSDFVLGDYGVDIADHVVWAVLDHNSEFAVVPEPGTLALPAAGCLGLVLTMIRRARRTGPPRIGHVPFRNQHG